MKATWLIFWSSFPSDFLSPRAESTLTQRDHVPKMPSVSLSFCRLRNLFQTFALRLWCSGPCASRALRPSQLAPWNQIERAMAEIFTPATQPLSHSEWLSGWVAGPATLAEWLSGCVSHSESLSGWVTDGQSGWVAGPATLAAELLSGCVSHSEWLSGWVAGPSTLAGWLSGWVAEWPGWMTLPSTSDGLAVWKSFWYIRDLSPVKFFTTHMASEFIFFAGSVSRWC